MIDDSVLSHLITSKQLIKLTDEEKKTYTYVAIPKNLPDGKIGDAYNINRPADFLILKVDKELTQFTKEK